MQWKGFESKESEMAVKTERCFENIASMLYTVKNIMSGSRNRLSIAHKVVMIERLEDGENVKDVAMHFKQIDFLLVALSLNQCKCIT
ncbi:hypothetical protein C0J52_25367 [Blattella germanica]|nr:hypothetical protein C0J52_25367 [Blattella germanica]